VREAVKRGAGGANDKGRGRKDLRNVCQLFLERGLRETQRFYLKSAGKLLHSLRVMGKKREEASRIREGTTRDVPQKRNRLKAGCAVSGR